ncbi:hypothetical protein DICPUDRAFT_157827 [Dictyostelium purpureum]|uniref:non-specific serine/threonine protein kinase n=1 Tax=Dictyostelium purpureum TaxID=5786 RepID=F1A036_DICPU|nr:uncharacterized protein DICPUDRAFT_157827 [Dictyostelium purpureum]EGC30451.1 hypothetical protein DICPUDRAFT_157827 [Dictyostelium purpureum]|eukprot:XP_003293030.1 hypothetical protein DICPUDRAFT_157827 [Dictyostelium purpureum]
MVGGLPSSSLWNIEYEDLLFKELIGKGNFGCVHRGSYLGVDVAIKKITMFDDAEYCKYTEREVKALRYIRHPLVVHFFGACRHETGFYLITEFIEGLDLRRYLKSTPKAPRWISRVNIALGVAKTFLFLHSKNILHRDLKSKNILLDISRNQIKLCDFGFARIGSQYSSGSDSSSSEEESDPEVVQTEGPYAFNGNGRAAHYRLRRMSICGTPSFMAPEVLLQQKYDWSIDVFSFGILMSELITLKRPGKDYWVRNANNGFDINIEELNSHIPSPNDCPVQFYDLCLKCCSYKNTNRPKFSDIVNILESIKDQLESSEQPLKKQSSFNNSNSINNNNGNSNNNNGNNNNSCIDIEKLNISNNSICEISVSNNSYMTNKSSSSNLLSTSSAYQPQQPSPLQQSQSSQQLHQSQSQQQQQQKSKIVGKLLSSNFDSCVTTNPISIFKERKRPQSFNKLLRVNTANLLSTSQQQLQPLQQSQSQAQLQLDESIPLQQYDKEGVLKLNQTQFPNGWKEFGVDSTVQKVWVVYQSNIVKINQLSQQTQINQNNNLIEIICCNIIKLKKHSITIGVIDCNNLVTGCCIVNVKPYIKEYPHVPKLFKFNQQEQQQKESNLITNNLELEILIKLQARTRGWLVRRRYRLIENEFTYKRQLDQVLKSYLLPIQSKFRINKPLLNYKEIGSIFSNIESLTEIHNELLKIVSEISRSPFFIMNFETERDQPQEKILLNNNEEFTNVSINAKNSSNQINSITQFIVKNISQIKNQYGIYTFNFKFATNILNWCKLNPDLTIFLEGIRNQLNQQFPEEENDLSSLLSLPINKIQKYLSVFEKLAQITPITHSEYKDIKTAYTLIKETSNYIQTQLEMSFEHSHIMSMDIMLQRKDNVSLIQSGRWFVKQGLLESLNKNNKQYYLFLLSDICLITKPIKSKSNSESKHNHHHHHHNREFNLTTSNNNLSNYRNKSNNNNKEDLANSINTGLATSTATNKEVLVNKKYFYRLRKTLSLHDVSMKINPDSPNSVLFFIPNKVYKWSLPTEEEARDWVNDFGRTTILIYRNQSTNGASDQNEMNQIHHINNQTLPSASEAKEKGFIKRFRLSFSAGTDRKPTLYQIHSSSSLTSETTSINSGGISSNNNSPNTPIKSVLSSPSINYTPLNNNENNENQQTNQDFQFAVPTAPADKKKKRNSFSSKLKRLSVTFGENKKNKEHSRE